MTVFTRFAVAYGSHPTELAASLNQAAAAGYGDVVQMALGPRGQVWAVVQADVDVEQLGPPSPPPAQPPAPEATERTTQIVSASTGRQVPAPSEAPAQGFATGDEPEEPAFRDPLAPPPKKEGPSTKAVSPAGRSG